MEEGNESAEVELREGQGWKGESLTEPEIAGYACLVEGM